MSDPCSLSPADAFGLDEIKAEAFWASACNVLGGCGMGLQRAAFWAIDAEAQQVHQMWADTGCPPRDRFEPIFYAAQDRFMTEFAQAFGEQMRNMSLDGHGSASEALLADIRDAEDSLSTNSQLFLMLMHPSVYDPTIFPPRPGFQPEVIATSPAQPRDLCP